MLPYQKNKFCLTEVWWDRFHDNVTHIKVVSKGIIRTKYIYFLTAYFQKWPLSALILDTNIVANRAANKKNQKQNGKWYRS